MVKFVNGKIELSELEVSDIIEISTLQKFLDNFALGMNCAAVSVDRKGKEITKPSYYREFCSNFIHASSVGDERCAVCHNQMGEAAMKQGKPYVGRCHAGLVDFAAPIIVAGEHLGTVLGGQVLDEQPEEGSIRKVAGEIGVNDEKLWQAAEKIDVINMKNINAAAEVLYIVVNTLAQSGYNRLEIELLSKNLAENFMQISQTVDSLAESAQDITGSQNTLTQKIQEVNDATQEITDILKAISAIAGKTKLIGLNASIEAARLGNDGRGFTVVAKEIQALAEKSHSTVQEVNELNRLINEKIASTIDDANSTLGTTEDQSAAMEELSATVQSSTILAERLRDLFL